jgi:hypothetical protein
MMKLGNSRAALRRYVIRRSPVDPYPIPEVPDGCLPVHTVVLDEPNRWARHRLERLKCVTGVQFIEYAWEAPHALCGVPVRVVYPTAFDGDADDACPECTSLAITRSIDPGEYERQLRDWERRERHREWRRVERRVTEEERQRALDDLDEFYLRQERARRGVILNDPSTWVFPDLQDDESEPQARGESA